MYEFDLELLEDIDSEVGGSVFVCNLFEMLFIDLPQVELRNPNWEREICRQHRLKYQVRSAR